MAEPRTPTAAQPIPQPPEKPIIGNLMDLGSATQVQDMMKLAREYGEIFSLSIAGHRTVVVSGFELVDELCDEKRFDKRVWAPLKNLRAFAGDGLFTAHTFEPNWKRAHDILLPAFGVAAMKGYHPMMLDVAYQLVERWERLNPQETIDVTDQMTRLTLDTIGLCGFDYRFNSFYRERMHPFVRAMTRSMAIALDRSVRPEFSNRMLWRENKRFRRAVSMMNETVDGIIQERKAAPDAEADPRKDLLACMLAGRDRETGEPLDDLNIRYQILTFLIAGHETTSGLLSFALYYLTVRPDLLEQATEEVDRVFGPDGDTPPSYRQVSELRFVRRLLNESLRLWPTAPAFSLFPKEGETRIGARDGSREDGRSGGGYRIDKRDALIVLTPMLHRDPSVWGDDPETFDPERFSPEDERARPANAFKPFGNGQRACIGRQFAMHEAALALGLILQRFRPIGDAGYQLQIKETLTLKPEGFFLRVEPRTRRRAVVRAAPTEGAAQSTSAEVETDEGSTVTTATAAPAPTHGTPLLVLYGSNMGTAEGIAERIGELGAARGFAVEVAPMDEYVERLPTEGAVVVVTSSYNGTPPDNAAAFCDWLEREEDDEALAGVRFAVFGCGNRDWASTYQRVPKLVDSRLEALGATRLTGRGEGDASDDFDGDFERWDDALWRDVAEAFDLELDAAEGTGLRVPIEVEVIEDRHPNPFVASFKAQPMVVVENRELQAGGSERSTRHLELTLPPSATYETGDHLGVIAKNPDALVARVLDRFGLEDDARLRIRRRGPGRTELPLDVPIRASRLLAEYVELQDPATRSQIKVLAEHTGCPPDLERLEALAAEPEEGDDRYRTEVLAVRRSLLDLLEEHAACEIPFAVFLALLPPLRPRYYSISSSPRALDRILSLTVAVVDGPARSGHGRYQGICSTYLAGKRRGEQIHAFVRDTGSSFRLPKSAATPLILVGPGTGIAPFRGFLQERAEQKRDGARLGPALLFFGCRRRDQDFLYREELEAFAADGVVELHTAFSRDQPEKRYVQDVIAEQGDRVWELLELGAAVYVCGDAGGMAPAVREAFARLHRERAGSDAETAEAWLGSLQESGRYLVDVWAST